MHIFDDFIYVYSPGAWADNTLGTNFRCQQKVLITLPICCRFKKCFEVRFYIPLFHVHHMYIAPGRGRQSIGEKFWCQQKDLFSLPICCKFQNDLFEIWFYTHFNDFIHVYSPGARAEKPLGTNFWCQQKALIASTICCKFQTNLFEFWFLHIFKCFSTCTGDSLYLKVQGTRQNTSSYQ